MLNYIWAGLIVFSLVFAMVHDLRDLSRDTYRNDRPLPVTLHFPEGYDPDARRVPLTVTIDPETFGAFYGTEARPAASYEGVLVQTREGRQLRFAEDVAVPEPLSTIRAMTSARDNDLRGLIGPLTLRGDTLAATTVTFPPVRFVKMHAIAEAAIDFAETAVTLALGLIGTLALWMGLLQIADRAGMLYSLVRLTQPVLRPLFPGIPKDHPALAMIVLNLTANMLGLGNAATPLGIKAMEELQKLNPEPDTATNDMVMLLAMNTASVQIVPPVLLVAIMGLQINQLFFSILIVTLLSLIVAIASAKVLGRLKAYRDTDPQRAAAGTGREDAGT
ncbi:nucleoside recognition protein [Rhodocaloribacter litoris]|uniref:nucleoside recognition domain-containing protein n=1 Tax=Rhodocaloribacter litoris TaxID=2558931 RepID=UPI00142318A9|nr:nucleoside recognition domain-containing protein [Rhodocaloribacter litoris]QXD16353.1 nucleoside recognition protein [Rhodocaloribacter litoris]